MPPKTKGRENFDGDNVGQGKSGTGEQRCNNKRKTSPRVGGSV